MSNPTTIRSLTHFIRILWLTLISSTLLLASCGGGSSPATPAGTAPTAASISVSTPKNTRVDGTLVASDLDGDPLTYSIVANGSLGTAVITNATTGAFTYTPNLGVSGTDSFSFKVNDGSADSDTARVTIAIGNTVPVAQDDNVSTNQDTATGMLNLPASDGDGDNLTFSIVSNGSMGTAVIMDAATGAYTYTPDPGQFGTDTFTFIASDGTDASNIATVTVAVNGSPVAAGSCYTTPQDKALGGQQLSASDPETTALSYSLIDPNDGLPVGAGPITTAKCASVELDPSTGIYIYTPDSTQGVTATCNSKGKRGIDTFDFQVSDPEGAVSDATETVIVDETFMLLGDSITLGTTCIGGTQTNNRCIVGGYLPENERVGYRKSLYDSLTGSGYTFDFVGTQQNGSTASPPLDEVDHEGHGGWTAFDIAWGRAMDGTDGVFGWLEQNPADFVLLHAGTNDLRNTTATDIADILDEIDRWENSANGNPVTVILARIIDWVPSNPDVDPFNDSVEEMVDGRTNDNIIVVDQQTGAGLNYNIGLDMSDWSHPSPSGYGKMADVWFDALTPVLDKCP
jgi:hypothetical protein